MNTPALPRLGDSVSFVGGDGRPENEGKTLVGIVNGEPIQHADEWWIPVYVRDGDNNVAVAFSNIVPGEPEPEPEPTESDCILMPFCALWEVRREIDPKRALWSALASSPATHLPVIEEWLYTRMRETSPGHFPEPV